MKTPKVNTNIIKDKKKRSEITFRIRQYAGLTILSAGFIGFVAQNLDKFTREFSMTIGFGVVFLILYFTTKR